jgi:hypothetical protein
LNAVKHVARREPTRERKSMTEYYTTFIQSLAAMADEVLTNFTADKPIEAPVLMECLQQGHARIRMTAYLDRVRIELAAVGSNGEGGSNHKKHAFHDTRAHQEFFIHN